MLRMTVFILLLFVLLPFASADDKLTTQEATSVRAAVTAFYEAAEGGWNYRGMNTSLVSDELYALIQLATAAGNRSAREISASDSPGDKPLMLDSAPFTANYEGYSKVLGIDNLRKNRDKYLADVRLVFDHASPPITWTDTAVVIKEDGRWKVDDIWFGGVEPVTDTDSVKRNLHRFAGWNARF